MSISLYVIEFGSEVINYKKIAKMSILPWAHISNAHMESKPKFVIIIMVSLFLSSVIFPKSMRLLTVNNR